MFCPWQRPPNGAISHPRKLFSTYEILYSYMSIVVVRFWLVYTLQQSISIKMYVPHNRFLLWTLVHQLADQLHGLFKQNVSIQWRKTGMKRCVEGKISITFWHIPLLFLGSCSSQLCNSAISQTGTKALKGKRSSEGKKWGEDLTNIYCYWSNVEIMWK